jgi:hypothetical protein
MHALEPEPLELIGARLFGGGWMPKLYISCTVAVIGANSAEK